MTQYNKKIISYIYFLIFVVLLTIRVGGQSYVDKGGTKHIVPYKPLVLGQSSFFNVSATVTEIPLVAYKYYKLDVTLWAGETSGFSEIRVYDRTTDLYIEPGDEATALGINVMNTNAISSVDNGNGRVNTGEWWTSWIGLGYGSTTPWSIKITFTTIAPAVALAYTITTGNSNDRAPKSWTFSGSNDDSNWTLLDTRTDMIWTAVHPGQIKGFIIP